MRWGQLLLCVWPGLSRLWLRGHGPSLLVAVGFSVLLNLALVSTFLWPALLGEAFPALAWPVIGLIWLGCMLVSVRMTPTWSRPPEMATVAERDRFTTQNNEQFTQHNTREHTQEIDASESLDTTSAASDANENSEYVVDNLTTTANRTLFNQAQTEYLKGHWDEAESLLLRQIQLDTRDVESRLLLATMYRRIERLDDAQQQLEKIERFDESTHWRFEISRELELIHEEREIDREFESVAEDKPRPGTQGPGELQTLKSVEQTKQHEQLDAGQEFRQADVEQDLTLTNEQLTDETTTTESTRVWLC